MRIKKDGSIEPESWLDLHNELFGFPKFEGIERFRSSFAYRGVDSAEFDLQTSLMRINNPSMEHHLLRNFRKYTRSEIENNDNDWELLALAQHYGLPTRMLDWSFSPYVALHFATSNLSLYKEDGAVWCLDLIKVHELLPQQYKDCLAAEGSYVFTVDMLHSLTTNTGNFNSEISVFDSHKKGDDFVICLEPPSIDARIVNQYAMFTVMTNRNRTLDDWLVRHQHLYKKIIIPAGLKVEVRDKLDQANVNERIIYPGLQGISSWLKRYYTKI